MKPLTKKASAARLSVASNAGLIALKLVVGFASGSVSILSEAVHSTGDLLASAIAYFSVKASDVPPDEDHPYGHGKIESISGMAEALLLLIAGIFVIVGAVGKLLDPGRHIIGDTRLGLATMALSAILNYVLSAYLLRVSKETDSMALEADAEHLRSDVLSSIGVFVGLALVSATKKPWIDPVVALIVAGFILWTALRLSKDALKPLLDERLPPEEKAQILEALETDESVLSYHKLRTRKAGSMRHADIHVLIEDNSTLIEAHDIAERLEDRIRAALPAIVVNIHIEPYHLEMKHQREEHADEIDRVTVLPRAK